MEDLNLIDGKWYKDKTKSYPYFTKYTNAEIGRREVYGFKHLYRNHYDELIRVNNTGITNGPTWLFYIKSAVLVTDSKDIELIKKYFPDEKFDNISTNKELTYNLF